MDTGKDDAFTRISFGAAMGGAGTALQCLWCASRARSAMSALRRRHPPPGGSADAQEESAAAPAPPAAPVHRSSEDLTNQRLAAVFLAIIAAAIYANTLNADFCYDDNFAIVNNKDVTGANPISAMWTHDFWGQNITKVRTHAPAITFPTLCCC